MGEIERDRAYALAAKRTEVARRIGDPTSPEAHAYLDRMLFEARQPLYDALVDAARDVEAALRVNNVHLDDWRRRLYSALAALDASEKAGSAK